MTHRDGGGKGRTHEQSSKLAKYPRSTYWAPSTIVGCRKNSKQDTRHSRCGMGAKAFLGSYSVLNPGLSSVHYLFNPKETGMKQEAGGRDETALKTEVEMGKIYAK